MPLRRRVSSLRGLCWTSLGQLCRQLVRQLARELRLRPRLLHEGDAFVLDEADLARSVAETRRYLMDDLPQSLLEDLAALWIDSVGLAVEQLKAKESPSADVYVTLRLAEVAVTARIQKLDLVGASRPVRMALCNRLCALPTTLRYLDLGDGVGGGWMSPAFLDDLYGKAAARLDVLVVFRLRNDCTNAVLRAVTDACGRSTLRELDVNFSKSVDDSTALTDLCRPDLLRVLEVEGTSIPVTGLTSVLRHFVKLEKFASDDLDRVFCAEEAPPLTNLVEVRCSSAGSAENGFHNCVPLVMSSKCPRLRKLTLNFHNEATAGLLLGGTGQLERHLADMIGLQDLKVVGCRGETLMDLVAPGEFGPRLRKLKLVHLEDLSHGCVMLIAERCPNLHTLVVQNCHIRRGFPLPSPANAGATWYSLSVLVLESRCPPDDGYNGTLASLLLLCPRLTELKLGIATGLCDQTICQVLSSGGLRRLQVFHVAHSQSLTMLGVFKVIHHCRELRVLSDLESMPRISRRQIQSLRKWIKEHNIMLLT